MIIFMFKVFSKEVIIFNLWYRGAGFWQGYETFSIIFWEHADINFYGGTKLFLREGILDEVIDQQTSGNDESSGPV